MVRDARRAWANTLLGRTLAERYRLDELIDVGGMGAVFVGRHLEVDRPVAIKTVVPGALDEVWTERLRREARQAAAVGGRGVVDVMDFGVDEVCGPFLVMELLSGETLEARLERGPRPSIEEACGLAAEILDTLARVHARGIVHRDLKPQNLFLARTDDDEVVVKILDFGIARPAEASGATLTTTGAVVGTPRFMAPEQARAERRVDARADVYAVGAILYTMLSGRRPYDDLEAHEALSAAAAGPPRPLRELAPRAPVAIAEVVDRAMAFDRERRFSNAEAMRVALREARGEPPAEVEDDETVSGVGVGSGIGPRSGSGSGRGRWALGVGLVAALAVIVAAVLGSLGASEGERDPPAAGAPPVEADEEDAEGREPVVEDDAVERIEPAAAARAADAVVAEEPEPADEGEPVEEAAPSARRRGRGAEPSAAAEGETTSDEGSPGRTGSLSMEDF